MTTNIFVLIVLLCLMLYYVSYMMHLLLLQHIQYMHMILTCLLVGLVASYLSVYSSVPPIRSRQAAPNRDCQIPVRNS